MNYEAKNTEYHSFAYDTTSYFGATENVPGTGHFWGAQIRHQW